MSNCKKNSHKWYLSLYGCTFGMWLWLSSDQKVKSVYWYLESVLSHVTCLANRTLADVVLAEDWKMLGLWCFASCCTWNSETTMWIGEQPIVQQLKNLLERPRRGKLGCLGQQPANLQLWVRLCSTIQPQPSLQKGTEIFWAQPANPQNYKAIIDYSFKPLSSGWFDI